MAEKLVNINLANKASSTIFTPPFDGNVSFYLRAIIVQCTSASGVVTPASISIGTNSTNFNNILPTTALTGLTTSGIYLRIPITIASPVAKSTPILVNVVTPIVGTSQVVTIYLDGYYS